MMFIYTAGSYREFRGYVFKLKKATTVTDKGTISALLKHPDFLRVDDEKTQAKATPAPVLTPLAPRQVLSVKRR